MFKRLVQVESGETRKVCLSFLHFFFILLAYNLVRPVRGSLLVAHYGSAALPKLYLASAGLLVLLGLAYNRLFKTLSRDRLLAASVILFSSSLLLFWWLLRARCEGAAAALYVWSSALGIMAVSQFWSFCHDLYDTRQGKRLYGFISLGGALGATLGGFLSAQLSVALGTENLLLPAAAALLPAAWLACRQHKDEERRLPCGPAGPPSVPDAGRDGFTLTMGSSHLRTLAGMTVGLMAIGVFVDYQFMRTLELEVPDKDRMTAYFGAMGALVHVTAACFQLFLTSRLQRWLGVRSCLAVLPALCLAEAAAFWAFPSLSGILLLEATFWSLEHSLNHTTRELLYLPLSREEKYKAKAFIDMAGSRLGDALGAAGILCCQAALGVPGTWAAAVTVGLLGLYGALVLRVERDYLESLRRMVLARSGELLGRGETRLDVSSPREGAEAGDIARRYALNLACRAALAGLPRSDAPSRAEAIGRIAREERRLAGGMAGALSRLDDTLHVEAAFRLMIHPTRSSAHLGYEFLDTLLPYPLRRDLLGLFNREVPLPRRAAWALRKHGAGPGDFAGYAHEIGLGLQETEALARLAADQRLGFAHPFLKTEETWISDRGAERRWS